MIVNSFFIFISFEIFCKDTTKIIIFVAAISNSTSYAELLADESLMRIICGNTIVTIFTKASRT